MLAVAVQELTGPDGLRLVELEPPADDGVHVLIDVHAAGVGFVDLLLSRGEYQDRLEPPFVLGIEVAGTVLTAPAGAPFAPGDRVAAYTKHGGFAEVAAAEPELTFALPDSFDFVEGAGYVVNYQTAYLALVQRGRVAPGEWVVVHGAGGGVGSACVQVAKALGARTIAVAGSAERAALARQAGADEVVDAGEGWRDRVRDLSGGRGVDVIADPVGGDRFDDSLRSLAPGGRLVVLGFSGRSIPTLGVNRILFRNVAVVGAAFGPYLEQVPGAAGEIDAALRDLAGRGLVRPLVGRRYPLEEAAQALRDLDERRALGKSVLVVGRQP